MMLPTQFVSELKALSFEDTFNPYVNRCAVYDKAGRRSPKSGHIAYLAC